MTKKFIAIVLALLLVFCFSACKKKSETYNPVQSGSSETASKEPLASEVSSNEWSEPEPVHKHNYLDATCTSPKVCDSCESTIGVALGHDYSSATCTKPKTCNRCRTTIGIPLGHDYSSATCTTPKICKHCGTVSGTALGHDFSKATCTTPKICYRCEQTRDDPLGHNFVNQKCTRCGKLDRVYLLEDIDYLSKSDYTQYTQEAFTDNQGKEYSGHYTFYSSWNGSGIEFEPRGKYKTFTGTAFLSYGDRGYTNDVRVKVYGDGKLLYQSDSLVKGCSPETFSIDVTGVSILRIELGASTFTANQGSIYTHNAMLTNAYFSK